MARDPINPTTDEARALARRLLADARHGALAVIHEGHPSVSRVALAPCPGGALTLVSELAPHTAALAAEPRAALLVGEPGRGDPLAHPRMTLRVRAEFLDKTPEAAALYLASQPKAKLYIGFADFHLVRLEIESASLNGGFGRAFHLGRDDFL